MRDLWTVHRPIVLLVIGSLVAMFFGRLRQIVRSMSLRFFVPLVITTSWVVWQGFFYQRMIGVADWFWLIFCGIVLAVWVG